MEGEGAAAGVVTPSALLVGTIRPKLDALAATLELPLASPEAELQILATAVHETGLRTRVQDGGGPGRSFWQLEAGIDALYDHATGRDLMADAVETEFGGQHPVVAPVRLLRCALSDPTMDGLACNLARLILWLDPRPLPGVGDEDAAWTCYRRVWRPGAERRAAWHADYAVTLASVRLADAVA